MSISQDLDAVLDGVVEGDPRVPGVVAMVTDRSENIYEGARGARDLGTGIPMTTDSVFAIFSTTKAITGTCVMQCVEEGLLDLDAPAKNFAPEIGRLQVLDGFDGDGNPVLRPPKRDITTRMLMLHTAGFGYDFFNEKYNRLAENHGQPSVITASRASIETPLLFDPGDMWEYGTNIDWAGEVVEGVRGKRLGEVMRERVFEPLGMVDIGFVMSPSMAERRATIHLRNADGSLTPQPDLVLFVGVGELLAAARQAAESVPGMDPALVPVAGAGIEPLAAAFRSRDRMWEGALVVPSGILGIGFDAARARVMQPDANVPAPAGAPAPAPVPAPVPTPAPTAPSTP